MGTIVGGVLGTLFGSKRGKRLSPAEIACARRSERRPLGRDADREADFGGTLGESVINACGEAGRRLSGSRIYGS